LRRTLLLLAAVVLGLWASPPAACAQEADDTVKATFFYRFAAFVTWPDHVFSGPDSPVVLCILGSDPFAVAVEEVVAGQQVGERVFEVRASADSAAARRCHAVYVAGSPAADTLRALRGAPVLTFTDGTAGGRHRGIVHFVLVDDRIRFHIDEALADEGGLTISSRLLSLALSVRQRRR
jgi:YfiR/HmsC-like